MNDVDFPEMQVVPLSEVQPNEWNPNELDPDIFNQLTEDIKEYGFVQPILVVPLENGEYKYRIVDGEHRYDALSILGSETIPVFVTDLDEDHQKFKTVRMNRLRGKLNMKKFTSLVKDLMERHSLEEVADNLAFVDPTELEEMLDNARESLPTTEMKDEFDKAKKDIKTVDDLSRVLNELFTKYGDTLPGNFMILDFGGKNHIWVQLAADEFKPIQAKARECLLAGVTFDSLLAHVCRNLPVDRYVEKFGSKLKAAVKEESTGEIDEAFDNE